MDVVKTNIERIGGTIDVKTSTAGRGTTFTIKIPLTLAIVSALIVEAAGERFAIPQIGVLELVRVGGLRRAGGAHQGRRRAAPARPAAAAGEALAAVLRLTRRRRRRGGYRLRRRHAGRRASPSASSSTASSTPRRSW
jgi:hypothetical protein